MVDPQRESVPAVTPLTRALETVRKLRAELAVASGSQLLAVVGAGLRFPGGICDLGSYWEALSNGRDLVVPLPQARRGPFAAEWDRLPHRGGFLEEVMDFDAEFFGLRAEEAAALDPQHRLLLEVAWEALENAALPPDRIDGARTGLFVGITNNDYWDWLDVSPDPNWAKGNGHYFAAGRLAYEMGLNGPAIAVDTACSSSLVAVHLARQALSRNECDVALAGGVSLTLSPRMTKQLNVTGFLAPDGVCKAFDARANGFPRGEGCGMVVLKRLADAQRDGDRILGVLKGSAVNQSGRSTGLASPNVLSLISLIQSALADADLTPADIGLVEAHGTGTSLGDTIEMEAIVCALGRANGGAPLPVGTVKANMGHTESAAGIAAVLKGLACLQHRAVPPLPHFTTLNPLIDLEGTNITLPTALTPWPQGATGRHVAINAFSMGGTNAHLILGPAEETPPRAGDDDPPVKGFELSARTPQAVRALASGLRHRLAELTEADYPAFAYTVTSGRTRHRWRAQVDASDREQALKALQALAAGEATSTTLLREQDHDQDTDAGAGGLPRAVVDLPPYPWQRQHHAPRPTARVTGPAATPVAALEAATDEQRQDDASPAAEAAVCLHELRWQEASHPDGTTGAAHTPETGRWLLFADRTGLGEALAEQLAARSGHCVQVRVGQRYRRLSDSRYEVDPSRPEDLAALFEDVRASGGAPWTGVVHAWSLDTPAPDAVGTGRPAQDAGTASAVHLVRALANERLEDMPRLVLLTRGAQPVAAQLAHSAVIPVPLWGVVGAAATEHNVPGPALIDLDPVPATDEAARLLEELLSGADERVALRGGARYAPVLVPRGRAGNAGQPRPFHAGRDENHRILAMQPGILDSLRPTLWRRTPPGPGQVEIEIGAAGLNFSDVLKAMGAYPGAVGTLPLGIECAGRVSAVGEGVTNHRVGDPVMAVVSSGLAAYGTTEAHLVAPRPKGLTDEQAAATPIAFLTAVYGLHYLARLRRGEKVLIHSATGGVGLAALMVARRCGAEVFATAGTEEKRRLLRELGVENSHVMDSRSLAFADEIARVTDGYGVDVVLNSLTGEALVRSLGLLAPSGRFVEIGKRDIYDDSPVGLGSFKDNRSLFAVDLEKTIWEQPQVVTELFDEIASGFADGGLKALPVSVFPYSEASEVFARMAQARHTGKMVLAPSGDEMVSVPPGGTPPRTTATYLVAGELGEGGVAAARQLADEGARHLVLVDGKAAEGDQASVDAALAELRSRQVEVQVLTADVSAYDEVVSVLTGIEQSMPPLGGIVQAATAPQVGAEPGHRTWAGPLTAAGWWLHQVAGERGVDFLVLGSPAASPDAAGGTGDADADDAEVRRRLLAVEPGRRRRNVLLRHVAELAARVLKTPDARLDPSAPLGSLGFDSMRTLELRTRLETSLRIKLPATVGWRYPTIDALVPFLAERMGIALEVGTAAGEPADTAAETPRVATRTQPPVEDAQTELDELSESEIAALLYARAEQLHKGRQG